MSNDFTKEELEMIYNMILHVRNDYPAVRKDNDACCLKHKIQSMIDNYCEHKNKCVNGAKLVCEDCEKEW